MDRSSTTCRKPIAIDAWYAAPLIVVLVGCALRLWHVADPSITGDEVNSLSFATRPIADLFAALATFEPHPPFYYTFLHVWVALAGQSEFALRAPSALLSTFGVACAYSAGRDVDGRRTGLATAAILAASQFSILHAQDARMYAALQAWVALYLAGLARYLVRPGRTSVLVMLVGGLLAAFTHYHGLLPVAFGGLAVLIVTPRRYVIRRLVPFGAIAVIFLPWVGFARHIFSGYPGWMDLVTPADALHRAFIAYSLGDSVTGPASRVALYILPFFALLGLASLGIRRRWRGIGMLLCVGVLPLAAVLVGEMTGRPLFHERYLIVITPALAVMAGCGLAGISQTTIGRCVGWAALAALGVVTLLPYYAPPSPRNTDYRATVALILDQARPLAVVAISPPQGPGVNYYLRDRLPTYTGHGEASLDQVSTALTALVAGRREAWFVRYSSGDWDDPIGNWLEAHAYYLRDKWITGNHVEDFALAPTEGVTERDVVVRVSGGFDLTRLRTGSSPVRPGDPVLVGMAWEASGSATGALPRTAKVSIRLIGPDGQRIAMLDRALANPSGLEKPNSPQVWNGALTVPVDAAPGIYGLEARFYDGATGAGWNLRADGEAPRDALDLATVVVESS